MTIFNNRLAILTCHDTKYGTLIDIFRQHAASIYGFVRPFRPSKKKI